MTGADISRMTGALYIDGPIRSASASRFWVLLVLAAIIATAGLISDSTATVIGAMIVAPLMTPILGTALAVVLGDRVHVVRSLGLVVAGAVVVIGVAWTMSMIGNPLDAYQGNTQVAARVNPRLIDLLAALATGTVGAFALVRSDVSDTLPGVAIAISLVPPLAVVRLCLQVGRTADAGGALLLFLTNFAAIVATGTLLLLGSRVRVAARSSGHPVGDLTGRTLAVVAAGVALVALPLAAGSLTVAVNERLAYRARPLAQLWAQEAGWTITTVTASGGTVIISALGPPPEADPADLRAAMNDSGLADAGLEIRLVVGGARVCPAGSEECLAPTSLDP